MLRTHEKKLVDRDRALRGLRAVLDADTVRELLELHTGREFEGLKRLYIRYKPGMNCLVGFGRNGTVECHVKTFRDDDRIKLDKVREKTVQYGDRDRRVVINEPPLVLAPFPSDSKLPTLARIFSDRGRRHLARIVQAETDDLLLQPLRYKPERRFVGKILNALQPVASFKTYTGRGLKRARIGLNVMAAQSEVPTAAFVDVAPRLRTVLHGWIDGPSLQWQLTNGTWSSDDVSELGHTLARLHRLQPADVPAWSRPHVADQIAGAVSSMAMLMPDCRSQLGRIGRLAMDGLSNLDGAAHLLHGDFNADQVIVEKSAIRLLDFDRCVVGPPVIDLSTFVSHLELDVAAGRLERDQAEAVAEHLVASYSSSGGACADDVMSSNPLVLFQLALTPFRRGDGDWPKQVRTVLDRCERLLSGSTTMAIYVAEAVGADEEDSPTRQDLRAKDADLLARALDLNHMAPLLENVIGGRGSMAQKGPLPRLLKRRPGKRFVVEYPGAEPGTGLVGKVRVKGFGDRSFQLSKNLCRQGFRDGNDEAFAVPEPVGTVPELQMTLYRRVESSIPWPWLESPEAAPIAGQIGRALARLHSVEPLTQRSHTISDELSILTDNLNRFASRRRYQIERVRRIAEACKELASGLPVHPVRGIHRDFHPDNIIVGDRSIYVIDFDLYSLGDPAIDAGNFVGHIVEWSLRRCGDEHALDHVAEAFCHSYLQHGGPPDYHRIQSFAVLTLARLTCLSTERTGREHTTERMIALCENRLRHPVGAA